MVSFNNESFNVSVQLLKEQSYAAPSGFVWGLYLDPERSAVFSFLGNRSWPKSAHDKRSTFICRVPANADANSVGEMMVSIKEWLSSLCESYKGCEWNGQNHIGSWGETETAHKAIYEYVSITGFSVPWNAYDWFSPCLEQIVLSNPGKTAEEIVSGEHLGQAGDPDGYVTEEAAIAFFEYVLANPDNYGIDLEEAA